MTDSPETGIIQAACRGDATAVHVELAQLSSVKLDEFYRVLSELRVKIGLIRTARRYACEWTLSCDRPTVACATRPPDHIAVYGICAHHTEVAKKKGHTVVHWPACNA